MSQDNPCPSCGTPIAGLLAGCTNPACPQSHGQTADEKRVERGLDDQ
jgi:hypothetical protein